MPFLENTRQSLRFPFASNSGSQPKRFRRRETVFAFGSAFSPSFLSPVAFAAASCALGLDRVQNPLGIVASLSRRHRLLLEFPSRAWIRGSNPHSGAGLIRFWWRSGGAFAEVDRFFYLPLFSTVVSVIWKGPFILIFVGVGVWRWIMARRIAAVSRICLSRFEIRNWSDCLGV